MLDQFLFLVRERVLNLFHPLLEIGSRRDYRALHLVFHLDLGGALVLLVLLLNA